MGYDTSGLRKVLEGGTGTHLLDGIFIDDYDANGAEVPEVKFTGTVYAEGAVSVYIFKVGIRGEIIFTTNLDLHEDEPRTASCGSRRSSRKLTNPICLFDVDGQDRGGALRVRRDRPVHHVRRSSRSRSSGSRCSNSN